MAGFGQRFPTSQPGTVYDPLAGGNVSAQGQAASIYPNDQPYAEAYRSPKQAGDANTAAAGASAATGAGYSVDPYGLTSYNNDSEQGRTTDRLHADLQAQAESRRLAALSSLYSQSGGATAPTVQHDAVAGNEQAARASAFARAKDQSGQIARSSLSALSNLMAARGTSGSGIEDLRSANILQGSEAPLQDLTREQYIQDLNRSAEISDLSYQGNIQQRGQTLDAANQQRQSLLGLMSAAYSGRAY